MSDVRQTVLHLQGVSKTFGPVVAVDGIDLAIRENEFFALLGPSGCGKTTLLRMLAGFETPTAGRILLDGRDIAPLPPEKRPLNLMFQSYALFPHLSVRRNIAYGLEMERLPKAEVARRVDQVLETTHLAPLADRRPDQLSGGQRQRVALARALVKRPRVLLLDEPLGALDKKLRERMQLELKRLQTEVGITFIVVTHDQEEALVMSDRIAVLKDGRIRQCGTPHEVYEHPADRFVADFIGAMNFIPGRLAEGGLRTAGGLVLPTPPGQGGVAWEGEAVIAVRPERLRIRPGGDRPAGHAVPGRIVEIAYHGLDLQVHVHTDIAEQPLLARVAAPRQDKAPLSVGMPVWLGWEAGDARLLDR